APPPTRSSGPWPSTSAATPPPSCAPPPAPPWPRSCAPANPPPPPPSPPAPRTTTAAPARPSPATRPACAPADDMSLRTYLFIHVQTASGRRGAGHVVARGRDSVVAGDDRAAHQAPVILRGRPIDRLAHLRPD